MINTIVVLGCLMVVTFGCTSTGGIQGALQCAVNNGGDLSKLIKFINDTNYYITSDLTELQKTSLLASNIMELYPDPFLYYPTYLNTKMVIYLDKAVINGNVGDFMKYAVEVLIPNNGFNSSGAQQFFDDLVNDNIPIQYNFNNGRDVLQAIVDYVNIDSSISTILFWAYDNDQLSTQDPNYYFQTLLAGLLDNFDLPSDAEELGEFIRTQVTIADTPDNIRPMIRDFLGSKYIPVSIADMVDEITLNKANWKQFTEVSYPAVIAALEWKYSEGELSKQFAGTQFEDEFNYVQRLISNYILTDFTQILYIDQTSASDYIFDQIGLFLNSTAIRDGYKDLYTILLKLPKVAIAGNDANSIADELSSFFDTTDIIDNELKDALSELFQYAADNGNNAISNAETQFWIEIREYVNSLNLASTTRAWFDENIQQTNMLSFKELDMLLYTKRIETHTYQCGYNCYHSYNSSYYDTNINAWQNFILLLIDIADKDDTTFGDFTGPFWPNNLIENANRVASNFKNAFYNNSEEVVYKFTKAILDSVTDMYEFEYPYNALLNITAQILPKLISEEANEYYFGEYTYVSGYYNYTNVWPYSIYIPGYSIETRGHPEEFVKDVLIIMENTLDTTLNMRDLIDTAQIYVEMSTFNETSFNGLIDFICDQTKDITIELCTVFDMVNATITIIDEFIIGYKNFTYKDSLNDIKGTFNLPEFLPLLEDFVDAVVTTLYPDEGATIVSAINATYNYWITSSITTNEIVNLIESIGNLYIMDSDSLEDRWKYTILYVKQVLNNIDTNTDIGDTIGNIIDNIVTLSPTNTPSPTLRTQTNPPTMKPTTLSPTPFELDDSHASHNYIILPFIFILLHILYLF